jgi:hypothetical protein
MHGVGLTRSSLLNLFGRDRKCRKQFYYYLDYYLGHDRRGWDLRINIESAQEVLDRLEKVDERIIACTNVFGCLSH